MEKVKAITKIDDMGLFIDKTDEVLVDSRFVAEAFDKNHFHVMRDIRNLLETDNEEVKEFNESNFGLVKYVDAKGEKVKEFNLHNFVGVTYKARNGQNQPCFAMTKNEWG